MNIHRSAAAEALTCQRGEAAQSIAVARARQQRALDELSGKRLLASYGIAVPRSVLVAAGDNLSDALDRLEPPFVVKVMAPDILHKSDVGGVKTGIGTVAGVEETIALMMSQPQIAAANVTGFIIEEMAPVGEEIVIGGVRDPNFGPLLMLGLGGIFVEVLRDVTFRICPVATIDAKEMIGELKGSAMLKGVRGRKPVSEDAIVDILMKMGGASGLLVQHAQDFSEIDLNPVIVSERAAVAVDARFILA
jgi:succinyl-CoA synthetase beta subunit